MTPADVLRVVREEIFRFAHALCCDHEDTPITIWAVGEAIKEMEKPNNTSGEPTCDTSSQPSTSSSSPVSSSTTESTPADGHGDSGSNVVETLRMATRALSNTLSLNEPLIHVDDRLGTVQARAYATHARARTVASCVPAVLAECERLRRDIDKFRANEKAYALAMSHGGHIDPTGVRCRIKIDALTARAEAAETERDALRKENCVQQNTITGLVIDCEGWEERVNEIATALGDKTEWTSENDRGINALLLAKTLPVNLAADENDRDALRAALNSANANLSGVREYLRESNAACEQFKNDIAGLSEERNTMRASRDEAAALLRESIEVECPGVALCRSDHHKRIRAYLAKIDGGGA